MSLNNNSNIEGYPNPFVMDAHNEVAEAIFGYLDLRVLGSMAQLNKRCRSIVANMVKNVHEALQSGGMNILSLLQKKYPTVANPKLTIDYVAQHLILSKDDLQNKYMQFLHPRGYEDRFTVFFFDSHSPDPVQAYSVGSHVEADFNQQTMELYRIKTDALLTDKYSFCVSSKIWEGVQKSDAVDSKPCPEKFLIPEVFKEIEKHPKRLSKAPSVEYSRILDIYERNRENSLLIHGIKTSHVWGSESGYQAFLVSNLPLPQVEEPEISDYESD